MRGVRRSLTAMCLVVPMAVGGCSAQPSTSPVTPAPTAGPITGTGGRTGAAPSTSPPSSRPDHVVVVILENKSYAQITNDTDATYLHSLMDRGQTFTNTHAITHPSQPNYLALFSGSTHGVTDDHCPVRLGNAANLGRQLIDAGLSFTGYAEGLPYAGYTGCSNGSYAAKHNPWADFANLPGTVNQPFTAFPTDFTRLPTVAFVVPNLCHDTHDCSVAAGDRWLRAHLDAYMTWADSHNSLLMVTYDEDDNSHANQILALVAGARVRPGHYSKPVTHYTFLATIEHWYGLSALGEARHATPIALW